MKTLILLFTTLFFLNSSLYSADSGCLNNISSATNISLDSEINAHLDADASDYYTFTLSSSEDVGIFTSSDIDTYGTLYDSSCNVIENDDDSGIVYNFYIARSLNAGSYYIKVRGYNKYINGDYTLNIATAMLPINTREFTKVLVNNIQDLNINGSALVIGNQLLCQNSSDGAECQAPTIGATNNDITQNHVIIDSNSSLSSNSMARLDLRAGDEIIWAGLYWSARLITNTTNNPSAAEIYMKTPASNSYKKYTSDPNKFNWYASGSTFDYACMQEVTEDVKSAGDGQYFVGGIQATNGTNRFASWALLVVVKNSERIFRNISIYDGFQAVYNDGDGGYPNSVDVVADGFLTPREEAVTSNLIIYTGESEAGLRDGASITDISGVEHDLIDAQNTSYDVFNASISTNGVHRSDSNDAGIADPNFQNVIGTDIDKLVISTLDNLQTSTTITIRSTLPSADRYTLNMFAFETELYVPEFCYDYAYKQEGIFFTEDNDGTKNPRIVGNVSDSEPIEVGIYVRNLVNSDIEVSDMVVNIIDINTSQATYQRESTKVAEIGDLIANYIPDSTLNVTDSYIEDINIGTIYSNDYFYTYYNLNPNTSDLDMPMNVSINYSLTYGGVTIPYNLTLGSEIAMCSGSNFEYKPVSGIFNIVHEGYYNSSTSYYNLPTQVTKREGNFKVISMDETNNDQLKAYPTIVAVEMIDVSGFHDIDPTCKEMGSTISEKVWIIFDDNATSVSFNKNSLDFAIANNMTQLTNSYDFYTNARDNAAFRVSYNSMDDNNSIVELVKDTNNNYTISNWKTEWTGKNCSQDIDNNLNTTDTVYDYCNLATGILTSGDLANCMECIYGFDTRFICSRDNFSIRPEAFLINLDDQNQTDTSSQARLTSNYSGVTNPTPDLLNLASGYNYNIEITATNFLDNIASNGYSQNFDTSNIDDLAHYRWESRSGLSADSCNDEGNKSLNIDFRNGIVDENTIVNEVGEYRLNILDTTWTTVDNNPLYMQHHTGTYFLDFSVPDCVPNSTVVQSNDPYPTQDILNGCDISSSHTNDNANLVYNDFNVTFHPYRFNMSSIVSSVGVDFNTTLSNNSFIYMSDITFNNNQDQNSSFHLNGSIIAEGYDGSRLSNFATSCYAKAINIDINNSDTTLTNIVGDTVEYQATLQNLDINGTVIVADVIDVNETNHQTPMQVQLTPQYFQKNLNGSVNTRLNLNFNKRNNLAVNPIRVIYSSYDVECTNPASDCTFSADLTNTKTTVGSLNLDQNITHYYGRTHAPLYRYTGPSGVGLIYYEVYCSGAGCDKTLLQDGVNSRYNDDPRWFINTQHTASFGTAGAVTQKGARNNITADNAGTNVTTGNHPDSMTFTYDAVLGYPYKGTMQSNPSRWLVYNPYDVNDTTNEFDIEYSKVDAGWSGVNSTDSSTTNDGAQRTNRRSMW